MAFGPAESVEEARLVARIAGGDDDALAVAYDRYAPLIYGAVIRFSGNRELAAEVVQDTFLALWRRAGTFDPHSAPLAGWLVAIARHRAIDRFRAEARRPSLVSISRSGGASSSVGPDQSAGRGPAMDRGRSPTTADDPSMLAERRWTQSVVASFVGQLPDVEREVLVLAYGGGLSQTEIAERIDLPLGTVKSRTRRALARLRTLLAGVPDLVPTRRESSLGDAGREQ